VRPALAVDCVVYFVVIAPETPHVLAETGVLKVVIDED